jgi:AcrR family transcriptional regulator
MATRGRRPVGSGTREAIVEEARRQFGERGYRDVTLRAVAQGAGVDPRLVLHYFGSKQGLFAASVELPIAPEVILQGIFAGDRAGIPDRAASLLLSVMEEPAARASFVGLLRSATSEPEAAEVVREILATRLLVPIAERVGGDAPELRAALMASQIVGLVMARSVVGVPPLVAASREQLVAAIVPVLRHYLEGDWVLPASGE